jgi:hypothetical protein
LAAAFGAAGSAAAFGAAGFVAAGFVAAAFVAFDAAGIAALALEARLAGTSGFGAGLRCFRKPWSSGGWPSPEPRGSMPESGARTSRVRGCMPEAYPENGRG